MSLNDAPVCLWMGNLQYKGYVTLKAYNRNDEVVIEHTYSLNEWYEKAHSIIDSNHKRKKMGVVKILGEQQHMTGELLTWELHYAASGQLVAEKRTASNGEVSMTRFDTV